MKAPFVPSGAFVFLFNAARGAELSSRERSERHVVDIEVARVGADEEL